MYDYSATPPYIDTRTGALLEQRRAVLGKVLGLLGFAFLFTAGGAAIGRTLGPGAFLLAVIGSFGTLIALQFLRERSPLNLGLLYGFATFEGILLGLILEAIPGERAAVLLAGSAPEEFSSVCSWRTSQGDRHLPQDPENLAAGRCDPG